MSIKFRKDGEIGYIEFDHPDSKVNILSAEVVKRLDSMIDEVGRNTTIKALAIVSKKKDIFIAGADIKEIEKISSPTDGAGKAKAGQDVFNKIEDLKIPTVAVIDGVAFGGGCELVLACKYRIATFNDKVRIGLPEVNLGILPGFGGTYRMPRLVGLSQGLALILQAKQVDSKKALKIGLVDRLVPSANMDYFIKEFISDVLAGKIRKPKKAKGLAGFQDNTWLGQQIVFIGAKMNVLNATKGFYPAPLKALETVKRNFYQSRGQGMITEHTAFGELVITDICKNLIHVFYMSEKFKKLSLSGADDVKPQAIRKSAVLGAGIMGGGIAQLLSYKGIWTRLKDISYDALAKGLQAAGYIYSQGVKKRVMTKADAQSSMARITTTVDYSGFADVDIVIEAVVENVEIKKKVFAELSNVAPKAILATNTSALSVTEMANATKDPTKVVGFHFFNPVHRMKLVEVITTNKASRETVVTALDLVKRLGKTPILVKDSCGFIVNRLLLGYINEAGFILDETGEMEAIDKLVTDFGMPMGPFVLSDEVGLDVGVKVMHILNNGFGDRYKLARIFEQVGEKKLLGKKAGKGFYIHSKKKRTPNPEIAELLAGRKIQPLNKEEALKRMIYFMINEAARCLEEGIVDGPDTIDIGMIFGTGFPPFHGGLLKYADHIGPGKIVDELQTLQRNLHADRFQPTKYLLQLKEQNRKFYP